MKKNRLTAGIPGLVLLLLVFLPGCRESLSPLPVSGGFREGGRRLGSELTIVPTESVVGTKSSFAGDAATVSNWTLLQFDAATGLLDAAYYQPSGADMTQIRVVTDRTYDWYAVANVGDVRGQFQIGSTQVSFLDGWYATGFDMKTATGIPMSWKRTGLAFSKADLAGGRKLDVEMTRLVARYDITVDKSALTRYSFQVTGVAIEGPASVRAFSGSKGTNVATITDAATSADLTRLNAGGAVSFYAAENLYGERAIADADSKKPKNLGANDHPTFIEIAGNATLLDGSGLAFGTTYRFYLGKNATTNFDVLRNTENTVTLHLTDAKIDAALAEQDLIAGGGVPGDPLWKVEIAPYTDTRSLQFQHGSASGNTGIRIPPGTCLAEGIVRAPAGMQYQFRLDQGLYDAGVRVYLDAARSAPVLPETGYTENNWLSVTGSPATLYFYLPPGVTDLAGQAHVRTLDGRKSDELSIAADRVLDHLSLDPAKTYIKNILADDHCYTLTAHFSDGSSMAITEYPDVTWTHSRKVRYKGDYNRGYLAYLYFIGTGSFQEGKIRFIGWNSDITNNYEIGENAGYPEITATNPQTLFTASWTCSGVTKTVDELGVITRDAASLAVTPTSQTVYTGGNVMYFSATVTYTDGSTENVTAQAVWNNDVRGLLVNNGGGSYSTGTTEGTTTLTASFGGVTSNAATVSVVDRTPRSVQLQVRNGSDWTTGDQSVNLGAYQQYRVKVTYDDGDEAYISDGFSLSSSNPAVVTVNDNTTCAAAVGNATVRAAYRGIESSNSIQLTVVSHNYVYKLIVSPLSLGASNTVEDILSLDAVGYRGLDYNDSDRFYAYDVRYDNGTLDTGYGTSGLLDVTDSASWEIATALTTVGTWTASSRKYLNRNETGSVVSGNVSASFNGRNGSFEVRARPYVAPYVRIREAGPLTWNCWEYGSGNKKTFHVEANVAWTLAGSNTDWYVSSSSGTADKTITVYPKNGNTGMDRNITLIVTANTDASLTGSIDLQQDGAEGSGANKLWWSVEISPSTKTIAVGETWSRFTATLVSYIDKDRTTEFARMDISNIARYEVSDPSVASIKSLEYATRTGEAKGLKAGTVTVTGWWLHPDPMTYREGSPVEMPGTATLTVTAESSASLAASTSSLMWTWDEAGSSAGKTVNVTATNCTWTVGSIPDDFGYSVSGNSLTVYPKAQNTSTTTDKTGTLVIQGTNGAADVTINLTQTKKPDSPPDPASLQVSPSALEWTWDESGSSCGKAATVTATNCTWTVGSIPDDFGYSVSGSTLTVYPKTQNSSQTADRTGMLVIAGSNGAEAVQIALRQLKKPAPVLSSLSFDREHYELVQVVEGTVSKTQSFRVTARYSDGSTSDVTASASYTDQGSVTVSTSACALTALSACSGKTLTASFGGLEAQATYTAVDLEIPVDLVGIHFESQEDQNREFVIDSFEATFRRVLSGATRTEEVSVTVEILNGPIVRDPDVDGMLLFHFTQPGSGTVAFSCTAGGVTVTRYLDVTCSEINHMTHTWR